MRRIHMGNNHTIDTRALYRMPWSKTDNAGSYLEITRSCNMACEYCPQTNIPCTDKPFIQVRHELDELISIRKSDVIHIAGGEPLVHADIVRIVRYVAYKGAKPVIMTNGLVLTRELLLDLKKAGLTGFVFHVDGGQNRPGWEGRNDTELNELRETYADMCLDAGVTCNFILTIIPEMLSHMRNVVSWAAANSHKVNNVVMIPVRGIQEGEEWDYYAGNVKIDIRTIIPTDKAYKRNDAADVYDEILESIPQYRFNSYLGGTIVALSPKWLFGTHFTVDGKVIGYAGRKGIEVMQSLNHLFRGKYLGHMKRGMYKRGKAILLLGLFDREIRKTFANYIGLVVRNPALLFKKVHMQMFVVLQPHDICPNGEQDCCDGCPNHTYWNGNVIPECRMEEYIRYGRTMIQVRKEPALKKIEERETVCGGVN